MKRVTNEDIKYLKRTLENMLYLKREEITNKELAKQIGKQIDAECKPNSMPYDGVQGCTTCAVTPYINELSILQATYEKKARDAKQKRQMLDLDNSITERFKMISIKYQEIIYAVYFKGEPINEIAEDCGIKVQTLREKIDFAIKKMLEVEPYGTVNMDKK